MVSLAPSGLLKHKREAGSIAMRVAYTGLAFLVTVLLARLLDAGELGRYFEIIAWVLLIGSAVQTGWAPFLVREVAALREHNKCAELVGISWLALRLVAAGAIVAALLMILVAHLTDTDPKSLRLVWLGALIIPFLSTSSMRQAITLGMGRPFLGQVCDYLVRPGVQVAGLVLWWLGLLGGASAALTAVAIFLAAVLASAALAYVLERRATAEVRKTAERKVPRRSEWLDPLTRIALMAWSSALNLQIGTLVLANVAADSEVATFRIAQQLSLLMASGLMAVGTLYAADLSRSFARDDPSWTQRLATKGALVAVATALPLAGAYILFGAPIIALLFGAQYSGAYEPLIVMTLGQLANAAFGLAAATAVAARSETAALRAYILSAVLNTLLCAILAPRLGAVGAAIGSAASLIGWNLLLYLHLRRRFGVRTFLPVGPVLQHFAKRAGASRDSRPD